jgi:hypothetical protein
MGKQRCFKCKKKTGIMAHTCKCNLIFCIKCRLPEQHNCTFDFKTEGKELLEKNLVKVEAKKVEKI